MNTDGWVTTALADDTVVVELLLRMKQSAAAVSQLPPPPRPTLAWGCRQARSKPASAKKDRDLMMRCSPTTPLSWSCGGGATSASPSDDSCRPSDLSYGNRSKGTYGNDSIVCSSAIKHSKRTKPFAELQEEKNLLIRERLNLKNKLETMHVTLKKQKVKSEKLKRLKTDLHQQSATGMISKSYYTDDLNFRQIKGAEGSRIDYVSASDNNNINNDHVVAANPIEAEKGFVLPDLNMTPSEDDSAFVA